MDFMSKLKKAANVLEDFVEDVNAKIGGDHIACPKCGEKSALDTKFCGNCGTNLSGVKPTITQVEQPEPAAVETRYTAAPTVDGVNAYYFNTNAAVNEKFEKIFADSFSGYEVKKMVSPAELGFAAETPCKPYDYALLKGGRVAAVIMLTPRNRDNNMAYKHAKAAAKSTKFINFYTHMDNEIGYVTDRIRSFL